MANPAQNEAPQGAFARLRADFSASAAVQGLVVAIVGYMSSVAILIKGLAAVGASEAQIASALLFVGITKGFAAMILSLSSRMPISVAWTTPGLVLLGTTGAVSGGFPAVIGAFLVTGALIVIAAFWSPLARFVQAIPRPIANAMLAGILFKLCLAPALAIQSKPLAAIVILLVWLLMMRFARLWAVPVAVLVALAWTGATTGFGKEGLTFQLPSPLVVMPEWNMTALFGLALPLFIVTMASQNITGLAVLSTFGFRHKPRDGLAITGLFSIISAPFGAPAINYAAITAALCAGPDAGPDPAKRYVAAFFSGIGYIFFALVAAIAAALVLNASPVLIEAAAGLALIGAFGSAMSQAIGEEEGRLPALVTFLITASGLTIFGIGGAFWGLLAGWGIFLAFRMPGKGGS
jgi:benzoate membrane transport protein